MADVAPTPPLQPVAQPLPQRVRRLIGNMTGAGRQPSSWQVETPTTAIYFSSVFEDMIGDNARGKGPIRRIEPNVFRVQGREDTHVVFRYLSKPLLETLKQRKSGRVLYFLDDDIEAAARDPHCPSDYQKRLRRLHNEIVAPICKIADEIIAPSQRVLDWLQPEKGSLANPALVHPLPDLSHHDNPDLMQLVFNGSRSHVNDLKMIAPALFEVLSRHPHARLTTFLGKYLPRELAHKQVINLNPMRWEDYSKFLRASRFHIALAPARKSGFNAARSPSRILDNASFGAASIYSDRLPFANWISPAVNGELAGDSTDDWICALERLIADRSYRKSLASKGCDLAQSIGSRDKVRNFWLEKLEIDGRSD